jgi:hypothetical protein
MSLIRVLRGAAATLTRTIYLDEAAADTASPPTVVVTRPDGTVVASGTAVDAPGTGNYTYTLPGGPTGPGSATWQLDLLRVSWTGSIGGATVTLTDTVEVVGGFLFGLAEARASDPSLANTTTYPTSLLAAKRLEVEVECERICGQAFVPRFGRAIVSGDGSGVVVLPHQQIRTVRAVQYLNADVWTTLDVVADFSIIPGSIVVHDYSYFPFGYSNIVVEYEHGWDSPPPDLVDAALMRLRSLLNRPRSGIADRALSQTTEFGTTIRYAMPGRDRTGIPDVDAVYESYTATVPGFA